MDSLIASAQQIVSGYNSKPDDYDSILNRHAHNFQPETGVTFNFITGTIDHLLKMGFKRERATGEIISPARGDAYGLINTVASFRNGQDQGFAEGIHLNLDVDDCIGSISRASESKPEGGFQEYDSKQSFQGYNPNHRFQEHDSKQSFQEAEYRNILNSAGGLYHDYTPESQHEEPCSKYADYATRCDEIFCGHQFNIFM